ncbi:MAG: L,D-transpeptidase [Hyphomicrobiales bacterium]
METRHFRRGCGIVAALLLFAVAALVSSAPAQAALKREVVAAPGHYARGTIIIRTHERRLYLITRRGEAIRYPVAVGKPGKAWAGRTRIDGKYVNPAWAPPAAVKRDIPSIPNLIPGGAPNNPMGVRALTLAGDEYAIHGTNRPKTIGKAASYGCIRMYNHDIVDLYERVRVGTPVIVEP